jgi:hypothetical protein
MTIRCPNALVAFLTGPQTLLAAFALMVLAAFLLVPSATQAQDVGGAAYRDGVWVGIGGGYGNASIDCSRCGSLDREHPWNGGGGGSGWIALGSALRPNLLVGLEINGYSLDRTTEAWDAWWGRSYPVVTETLLATANVTAQFYPHATSRAFVRGGIGYGLASLMTREHFVLLGLQETSHDAHGGALLLGGGYDIVVHRSYAIVPFAGVIQLVTGRASLEDGQGPSSPRYLQLGIALVRY